jgi:serine/threonine protein kinase
MQRLFKHYCLNEQIASKTARSVYLAHSIGDVSEKVMLKVFDAQCLPLDQENESVLQQVEWIKQLRHPHILPILDLGVEQGQPYVVSAYMSNDSLRRYLDRVFPKQLDLQEALTIISQVGQALCYAHEHGLLHGNIKPGNIFFNDSGEVLLTDFSLANFIDVTKLDYKSDLHTICYLAPEQFIGSMSEKSDQYALACLAYELITGHVPFTAYSFSLIWLQHFSEAPIALTTMVPHLPKMLEAVVLKAMAKDPSKRYADVSAFLGALEGVWPSPTSVFTHPVAKSPAPFPFSLPQLFDSMESRVALPQLLEKRESQTPLPQQLEDIKNDVPSTSRLHKSWEHIQSEYNASVTLPIPARGDHIDTLPTIQQPRRRKQSISVWLMLTLCGVVMGAIISPIFLPFYVPESIGHVKRSPPAQIVANTSDPAPSVQPTPSIQPTQLPTVGIFPGTLSTLTPQPRHASLSGSYAEQTSEAYNLTTEGKLDWIHWGLHAPGDVDRKNGVQPQISGFTLIGNGTLQRDGQYSNAYVWSDGTPVASVGQVPSGVYVTGVKNGFAISVPASITPRTLRVYIAANLAQGQFTASLDGDTYIDVSLNMMHDPYNVEDNGIYSLVFSSSAPNQTLNVTYTAINTNGSNGYVMLQAATFQ